MANARAVLAKSPDLGDLGSSTLDGLAAAATVRRYRPGERITSDEDGEHGLFVLASGLVEIERRTGSRRAPLRFVAHPPALFGADALLGAPWEGARAYSAVEVAEIPMAALTVARRRDPEVEFVVARLTTLFREAPWLCDCLRRTAVLRRAAPDEALALLSSARIIEAPPLTLLAAAGSELGGITIVLKGELFLRGAGGTMRLLERGQVFGDLEVVACRPAAYDVLTGVNPCVLVRVDTAAVDALLVRESAFRRGVLASEYGSAEQRAQLLGRASADRPEKLHVLHVTGDASPMALRTAAAWLGEVNARAFRDRVAIVDLDPGAPAEPSIERPTRDAAEVPLRVQARPDADPARHPSLLRALHRADTVYVASAHGAVDPGAPWLRDVETTVWLASQPWRPVPPEVVARIAEPVVYTTVVPGGRDLDEIPRKSVRISRGLLDAAAAGTPLSALAPELVAEVERWARAATHRRVGLALSGGGALGYAHVPLIRAIHRAGLPIDLVTGTSAGALIGAFYAVQGLAGLERVVEYGSEVQRIAVRAMFSSRALAAPVDRWLDGARLQDLLVPFYTTAVDVDTAFQLTLATGSVGTAVRAAGTMPPAFGPTVLFSRGRRRRVVDGAALNNIPDDTAYLEGARVVVASNVLGAPRAEAPRGVPSRWLARLPALASLLEEARPIGRYHDVMRVVAFAMHQPADWDNRRADVRFRPIDTGFTPVDWGRAADIVAAGERNREELDAAVASLTAELRALRWRRTRKGTEGPLLDGVVANLSVALPALSGRMSIQVPPRPLPEGD